MEPESILEAPQCLREQGLGLHTIRLQTRNLREAFITVPAVGKEEPTWVLKRLYDYLETQPDFRIVRQDVFGVASTASHRRQLRAYRLGSAEWPLTWVQEGNGEGAPLAGIQVHAVADVAVTPLWLDERVVGTVFDTPTARFCALGGLRPALASAPRRDQARETFDLMEEALALAGMTFKHVCRTWFYLEDILDWYEAFNQVRNEFFAARGVFNGVVPASTGVGGSNAAGTAVVADLIAVRPKDPRVTLRAIPSPLQCPAPEYGSSFSRAVELSLPDHRRLYVSGTASIAPDGKTVHGEDPEGQVRLTMEVVEAILRSREMDWSNVTRAIGYFKHAEDAPVFERWLTAQKLAPLPAIIAKNDICRDDLLFEIEVDAIRTGPGEGRPDCPG